MSPRAGFLLQNQIVPRLRSAIPQVAHCVGAEDSQELVQDAIAMAAKLMHNVERKRKKVTPGNIAYYTIQHIKSGRRSTGSSVVDIMAAGTQLKGNTRLHSLEEVVATDAETGGEIFLLHDVLSNDQEDPATKAARKLDWQEFVTALPEREKAIIEFMLEGKTLRDAAHALKCSDSTMQLSKRELGLKILEFMGYHILVDIQRRPQWRQNLEAIHERQACRDERRHL